MSHDQTATPTPRIAITPAKDAAPPWAGKYFTCGKCGGEFQLEAADKCELRLIVSDHLRAYDTPPCPCSWTKPKESCGHINVIELRVEEAEVEGNPS